MSFMSFLLGLCPVWSRHPPGDEPWHGTRLFGQPAVMNKAVSVALFAASLALPTPWFPARELRSPATVAAEGKEDGASRFCASSLHARARQWRCRRRCQGERHGCGLRAKRCPDASRKKCCWTSPRRNARGHAAGGRPQEDPRRCASRSPISRLRITSFPRTVSSASGSLCVSFSRSRPRSDSSCRSSSEARTSC